MLDLLDYAISNKLTVRLILDVPNDSWSDVTTGVPVAIHSNLGMVELQTQVPKRVTYLLLNHIVALQFVTHKAEVEAVAEKNDKETASAATKSRK